MMRVLGLVPARCGSKTITFKNIKLLAGRPLIDYTLAPAIESRLAKLVVSTDCDQILNHVQDHFEVVAIRRPPEISTDTAKTIDAVIHALEVLEDEFDAVMILQPTSPFRTTEQINQVIDQFASGDYDSMVSVEDVPHNFSAQKLMTLENDLLSGGLSFNRKQDVLKRFARNGAYYLTKTHFLDTGTLVGGKIGAFPMSKVDSLDIDDQDDWLIAEGIIHFRNAKEGQ